MVGKVGERKLRYYSECLAYSGSNKNDLFLESSKPDQIEAITFKLEQMENTLNDLVNILVSLY